MKVPIYSSASKSEKEVTLPPQFNESYRPDLIKRAVLALQSAARQAYGAHPEAGKRHSSDLSKRRRKYRGSYGFGISRVNRKILSRRGTRMHWVGAFSPHTRGGFRAHPPKAQKNFIQSINKKENRKAIRSAIAATVAKELVQQRGHYVPETYPFVLAATTEALDKTSAVHKLLMDLGFAEELQRSLVKKVRAGIGKLRGRKYQRRKGLLVVVGDDCALLRAARNIPGLDVVSVSALNAELLAPGAQPGRVTLWTENAIKRLEEEQLFQ